jgi:hypothetical protein
MPFSATLWASSAGSLNKRGRISEEYIMGTSKVATGLDLQDEPGHPKPPCAL